MTPRKEILSLLHKEAQLSNVKDYSKLNQAFVYYMQGRFFLMSEEIKSYETFDFFKDLFVYLDDRYKSDDLKNNTYIDIRETYFKIEELFNDYFTEKPHLM